MSKRSMLAALAVTVVTIAGATTAAVVVTRGESCTAGLGPVDVEHRALPVGEVDALLPGPTRPSWGIEIDPDLTSAVVDVGGWAAHVRSFAVSRFDVGSDSTWSWGLRGVGLFRAQPVADERLAAIWRASGDGGVVLLDAEGVVVACRRVEQVIDGPAVADDGGLLAIVRTDDTGTAALIRHDVDGAERWRMPIETGPVELRRWDRTLVAVTASTAFAGLDEGVVAVDDATGAERWVLSATDLGGAFVTAIGETEEIAVLVAARPDRQREVVAVGLTSGDVRWRSEPLGLADDLTYATALTIDDTIVVRGRSVLVALDASDGSIRWRVDDVQDPALFHRRDIVLLDDQGREALLPGPGAVVDLVDGRTRPWLTDDGLGSGVALVGDVVIQDLQVLADGRSRSLILGWELGDLVDG